jgi:hypothetical protein
MHSGRGRKKTTVRLPLRKKRRKIPPPSCRYARRKEEERLPLGCRSCRPNTRMYTSSRSFISPLQPHLYSRRSIIPLGVESEVVSLVLPAKPTMWERSPNYLDPSRWGVESEAASLMLPTKPTLREGFSLIILIFLCWV